MDIPESEMATAAYLIAMVQQRLIITVEIDDGKSNTAINRRAAKKAKVITPYLLVMTISGWALVAHSASYPINIAT